MPGTVGVIQIHASKNDTEQEAIRLPDSPKEKESIIMSFWDTKEVYSI